MLTLPTRTVHRLDDWPGGRHYVIAGELGAWPSVTTCLTMIPKGAALTRWMLRTALQHYAAHARHASRWEDPIQDAMDAPNRERDLAAQEGSEAHDLIDRLLKGERPDIPDHLQPAVDAAMDFIRDYRLTIIKSEARLWHPGLKYAGAVDLLAEDPQGRLVVADWKRTGGIYLESVGPQLAAYAACVEVLTGRKVDQGIAVQLPKQRGATRPRCWSAKTWPWRSGYSSRPWNCSTPWSVPGSTLIWSDQSPIMALTSTTRGARVGESALGPAG